MVDWTQLVSTNGVEVSVNTPLYGGPQKAGTSITLGKFAEFSVGGVQYNGLTWSMLETDSGSVIVTGLDNITEAGVYYEFKNDTGETIRNPDGSFKAVSRFGAVLEVGIVSNGTSIDDASGITVGAGGQIALGKNGIGYSQEKDINSGLFTNTVTIGPGAANIGLVVTSANILNIARESVSRDITPSIVVKNAPFLGDGPLDRQFLIINAFDDTGGNFAEIANFLVRNNSAAAFEKDGRLVFYLRTRDGDEYYYDPDTGEYFAIDTGIGYLGVNISSAEMNTILQAAQTASGETLSVVTPSERPDSCFGPEVPIDMWPLDPDLEPGPDGIYDQNAVRAKVWKKPIELIQVGDLVVSFDDDGNLVPGPVTRTFQNNAKILLNFHGTRVTPGHVYYRPDSKKSYKYETLIDVLRDDGVIQKQDGTLIRAATNVPVDSPRDGFVRAVAGMRKADGSFTQTDEGRIRLGTRFLIGTGEERKSVSVAGLIERNGGIVGDDELIHVGDGPGVPFTWDFGDTLPKPEDFVLACSGTTLEDIYKAAEWESQGPRLPAPMVLDRGPVQPLKGVALSEMPRNEPLNVTHAPMAATKPQRTLNREQRKAMEAQQRKAAKTRKRLVG
jgi:hypothetical protein